MLAEIETDKATMEVEAVDDGRVGKILVPEGTQGVKVNQPIALLLRRRRGSFGAHRRRRGSREGGSSSRSAQEQPKLAAALRRLQRRLTPPGTAGNGRIFASPLARRMAQQAGLDLAAITGSGPQGRIVKADIEAALTDRSRTGHGSRAAGRPSGAPLPAAPPPPAAATPLSKERVLALAGNLPHIERPLTAMRRVIARRLTESKQTVPAFLSDDRLRDRRAAEISQRT